MKVMVIIKASKDSEAGKMPSEKLLTDMGNYNEQLVKAGIMLAGDGLHPSSKGVRVAFNGADRTVIDGPFAETKELIAGFWIWKVNSMAEAIEWIKKCPNPHEEPCEVELRQVFSADDFGAEFTPELREQEYRLRGESLGLTGIRFEDAAAKTIAGLSKTYTTQTLSQIPAHWGEFAPSIGRVPGQVGTAAYGVCHNPKEDCQFDYLTGVEISGTPKLPAGFTTVQVPAGRYAIATHQGHISGIHLTLDTIWKKWIPDAELKPAKSPWYEKYTDAWDPKTSSGPVEIWIPLAG
jgi:AraC family transcriptional regulator